MAGITNKQAFLLILLTTVFTTIAQAFLKTALNSTPLNWFLLVIGASLYVIGAGVMILAFKGGDVSLLYPVIATSQLWVTLISHYWFHESVHLLRWIGVFVILAGITIIGFAQPKVTA